MVTRYKFNDVVTPGMYPEQDGNYVKYEDYANLKADRDYWYEKCLDAGLLDEERAGTNF